MRKFLILLFILLSLSSIYTEIRAGYINITGYDFDNDDPIKLSGEWNITYEDGTKTYSRVPSDWAGDDKRVTYALTILSQEQELILAPTQVNSEYILLLNGEKVLEEKSYRYLYIPIKMKSGVNTLEFIITNRDDPVGGIRNSPFLGGHEIMRKKHIISYFRDAIFAGANIIVAIFFLILFLRYNRDISSLYFAILCMVLAIRGVVINDKLLFLFIKNLSGNAVQRVEYFCVYSLPLLFMLFIKSYFNYRPHRKPYNVLTFLTIPFPICVLLLPPLQYKSLLFIYFITSFVVIIFILSTIIFYIYKRLKDSVKIFISILLVGLAAISDISMVLFNNFETHILSIFLIIFILYMLYNIFSSETRKLLRRSQLKDENAQVNKYLHKFVPSKYIKSIGLGDTFSIKDGDGVDREMTILFASIKGFHQEFSLHGAEEGIKLLNRAFSIISPILIKHNGLIDKFIDETIMVLFPDDPNTAVDAVLELNTYLEEYNRQNPALYPIEIYSGIHIGPCHFGIVGDGKRSDITVISKTVNKASRIHSFSKKIDRAILISDELYQKLEIKEHFNYLYMGRVKLKGNSNFVGIHTIFQGAITEADSLFSMTMRKLENSSLYDIESVLQRIKTLHRGHKPSNYYLDLINSNRKLEELEK